MPKSSSRRIFELDLLRGFFICVIILDHLQFWPSPLQYLTGQGRLWASAAEGFFLISGLLVGYLRAYKQRDIPLRTISIGLWKRAFMLYAWCIGITFAVVSLSVLVTHDNALLPKLPESAVVASLPTYITSVITSHYASDWIYFLRLYAIVLAITPLFLFLIRKNLWWVGVLLSLTVYALSLVFVIDEASMQWQVLFFGAAFIGWKLEAILAWLAARPRVRSGLLISLIFVAFSSMALSYFMVHGWNIVERPNARFSREAYVSVRATVDPLFSNNPMVPLRLLIASLWFGGLLAFFHVAKSFLLKWFGWLLLSFGQASLTAYCIQAIVLVFIVAYIPVTSSFWLNGLVGIGVLLLFSGLLRVPLLQKIFPR